MSKNNKILLRHLAHEALDQWWKHEKRKRDAMKKRTLLYEEMGKMLGVKNPHISSLSEDQLKKVIDYFQENPFNKVKVGSSVSILDIFPEIKKKKEEEKYKEVSFTQALGLYEVIKYSAMKIFAEDFAKESNQIEGEELPTGRQIRAVEWVLEHKIENSKDLHFLHRLCTYHDQKAKKEWGGKYRKIQVYIGNHVPPTHTKVPYLMGALMRKVKKMEISSFEAHNRFQKIHPYQDFNGRIGRLLWLSLAYHNEGFRGGISFLHKYYYQTLAQMR